MTRTKRYIVSCQSIVTTHSEAGTNNRDLSLYSCQILNLHSRKWVTIGTQDLFKLILFSRKFFYQSIQKIIKLILYNYNKVN